MEYAPRQKQWFALFHGPISAALLGLHANIRCPRLHVLFTKRGRVYVLRFKSTTGAPSPMLMREPANIRSVLRPANSIRPKPYELLHDASADSRLDFQHG